MGVASAIARAINLIQVTAVVMVVAGWHMPAPVAVTAGIKAAIAVVVAVTVVTRAAIAAVVVTAIAVTAVVVAMEVEVTR